MTVRKIAGYGWHPDLPDHRDRIYNLEERILKSVELDPVFSLRGEMPEVYDQGQLGSCTANGVGAVLEHGQMVQGQGAVTPSRLFIYYGERVIEGTVPTDAGAQVRDGIKVVASEGAPPEEPDWPYDISQFAQKPSPKAYEDAKNHVAIEYLRIEPGAGGDPIRTALAAKAPVVFGFSVPSRFESPEWTAASEVLPLPEPTEQAIGGHCVVAIGWDFSRTRFPGVDAFEIRNSWGPGWGDRGHFWMDARWLTEPSRSLSSDFWVIRRTA
jgi:C1A family cysteine protease